MSNLNERFSINSDMEEDEVSESMDTDSSTSDTDYTTGNSSNENSTDYEDYSTFNFLTAPEISRTDLLNLIKDPLLREEFGEIALLCINSSLDLYDPIISPELRTTIKLLRILEHLNSIVRDGVTTTDQDSETATRQVTRSMTTRTAIRSETNLRFSNSVTMQVPSRASTAMQSINSMTMQEASGVATPLQSTSSVTMHEFFSAVPAHQSIHSMTMQEPPEAVTAVQSINSVAMQEPSGAAIALQSTSSVTMQEPPGNVTAVQSINSVAMQAPSRATTNSVIMRGSSESVINCDQQASTSHNNLATVKFESVDATDDFFCPICFEGMTNTGQHRPSCLKCGHIFGEKCLRKWIKGSCNNKAKRCPTCNTKAVLKDIRILFTKHLFAIDTAELTALEVKLSNEYQEKQIMQQEIEILKFKSDTLTKDVQRLHSTIGQLKAGKPSTIPPKSARKCIKRITLCKKPSCRVMAYNKKNMLLVASQASDSQFCPSQIIRKVNASLLEVTKDCVFAHTKQIRDMTFNPSEYNLLASVALDKCINLIDMTSNSVVSSIQVDEPLWSCCWAGNNQNLLIAGGQSGSLYYIDRRFMKLLQSECIRKPACVSLVTLPSSTTRSFINGGFLKTRMDFLSLFESNSNHNSFIELELPLKGFWTSTSFDSQSNLILLSAKPCGTNTTTRHIVSKISNLNEEGPVIKSVVTFYGGTKATQLSRSCLIPANQGNEDIMVCSHDEMSSTVKLYGVNSRKYMHSYNVKDNYSDFCTLTGVINGGMRTVAGLSENAISIFTV